MEELVKTSKECMDEQQAITQLKLGDLNGLEFLVEKYQVQAVQSAYLILGEHPSAEDIVQTAFLKIARKIHQFDPRYPFRPWFLRTVINDAIKATKRQRKSISLDEPADDAVSGWLMDNTPRPEELAETSDLQRRVWAVLQQLPPEQRAVIVQRHFLEMSEAEMVEKLQRPASTVKWWLHTARKNLKALLQGEKHDQR
jgi:RNA polymerase sigma-70 factor, ECF subfamily